jgi:hypothetical protein
MKRKVLWSALAALPLLMAAAWVGIYHTANAATPANAPAKTVKAVDCCLDPTCPPGCSEDCPPNCCDVVSVKTTAKKTACCSEGSECCPDGDCCPTANTTAIAKATQKKYICPPCPFCPGW